MAFVMLGQSLGNAQNLNISQVLQSIPVHFPVHNTELHGKHSRLAGIAGRFWSWSPDHSVTTEFIKLSHIVIPHVPEFCSSNALR